MDINGFIAVILAFFIVAGSSDALFVWNFRKLTDAVPNNTSPDTRISPSLSPVSGGGSKRNPIDADESGKKKLNDHQGTTDSSKADPKGSSNSTTGSVTPTTEKQADKEKNHQGSEKGDKTTDSRLGTNESCKESPKSCTDDKSILACFHAGPREWILLVQNEEESILKVNLSIPISEENHWQTFEISGHQTTKINITSSMGKSSKIVLNAGNKDCVIHMETPDYKREFFKKISFYSKQITPIYGAYFLLLVTLIFGGAWACCNLRKRRRLGGVAYQELEMGLPESASAVNVDTAEGWDQDWDDDWDEDKAVKSPGGHHVGSISANGLTSRSSRKDGWENDWDD
ncbi:unnamed protein product [Ilex paraguariensis]|uniref:DUF7356 domain-containing protein n=1 Tax=Ilex paraguariensis TaxID=185542 RepID=A0ABC8RHP1_9AQUA